DLVVHVIANALFTQGNLGAGETSRSVANDGGHIESGDASLWISTKPANAPFTTVSSSDWASNVINGVAIVVHGTGLTAPTISGIPNQFTMENTTLTAIPFSVDDFDTALSD